ncbi:carbon starvation protein A [Candidatus Borrarchaeum sp.]|uniref:carbon starvation CstA family protein n=1 Tax=Candidatus Borrarchaeum sp. TaxID=2846742 RepID=UPI00257DE9DD|nr:carbon starvation CstA family protein [Candidatus Borrarchaeum sp.]
MALFPAYFVALGLVVYLVAYFVYAKWYDKNIWGPDPKKTTPAHMYMDGVEFFPTGRYVLYGFQFKGIAGAAPIVGPFVALSFGWLPALLWILLGNFFIGWLHDYNSLFVSIRNEGKTLGPLTYEFISPRTRNVLMGFLVFYLLTITAAFMWVIATLFTLRGGAMIFILFVFAAGIISGVMLYIMKLPLSVTTIAGVIIMIIGIIVGSWLIPLPFWGYASLAAADNAGIYGLMLILISVLCLFGAVLPIIRYAQPVNYMAFWPCLAGIILLIVAELASPLTGIALQPPAIPTKWYFPSLASGPVWPMLFVAIACGAISGWHSLVGTSGSARQLDLETDALPIGAGSMLTEGLLALAALGAYMALDTATAVSLGSVGGLAGGASALLLPILGAAASPAVWTFFVAFIALYAITVLQLVIRFMRMALLEMTANIPPLRALFANKWVASIICLLLGGIFAYSGLFTFIWYLFGGANQLMAGLMLLLSTVYLASIKKTTKYNLIPAIFMIVTCLAALLYLSGVMLYRTAIGQPLVARLLALPQNIGWATAFTVAFGVVGLILVILGLIMAYDSFKSLRRIWAASS